MQLEPPSTQVETTQPEPSSVQVSTSLAGRTKIDASEVSLTTAAMRQASTSAPSAPPTTEGAIPEVEPPWEGLASLGADVGSS
jgi:hypothetical protein